MCVFDGFWTFAWERSACDKTLSLLVRNVLNLLNDNNTNNSSSDCSGSATQKCDKRGIRWRDARNHISVIWLLFCCPFNIHMRVGTARMHPPQFSNTEKIITNNSLAWIKVYSIAIVFIRIISIDLVGRMWGSCAHFLIWPQTIYIYIDIYKFRVTTESATNT